jgi:alkylresorcinol/alkylpyrone synthase
MTSVRLHAVGTAVPQHRTTQSDVRAIVEALYRGTVPNLERLLAVFEHGHIGTRYLVQDAAWYARDRGFKESNDMFRTSAIELSSRAAEDAFSQCNVDRADIAHVVFVNTTGVATPSIDAELIARCGLSRNTLRTPIFGLGCAGGVVGLARAADASRAAGGAPVLLVSTEICSVTFQRGDTSKSNIVGASLFGDGSAAVIVSADGAGPIIHRGYSTLFPDTDDIMGWDVIDTGFKVRFSRDIPDFVREHLPRTFNAACEAWGVDQTDIGTFIAHPGGARVLEAYAECLGVPEEDVAVAKRVLHEYGNMSSASVLFVLREFLRDNAPWPSRYGAALSLGPGFSAEMLLLERSA